MISRPTDGPPRLRHRPNQETSLKKRNFAPYFALSAVVAVRSWDPGSSRAVAGHDGPIASPRKSDGATCTRPSRAIRFAFPDRLAV